MSASIRYLALLAAGTAVLAFAAVFPRVPGEPQPDRDGMNRSSPDPYVHTAGFWQHWTGRLLRRVPFALCGMWLGADTDTGYPGPDGPLCPSCASQITVRQWFALPRAERARRAAEFRAADAALQEYRPPGRQEDEIYDDLNGRVNDLWPTVPWWVRS